MDRQHTTLCKAPCPSMPSGTSLSALLAGVFLKITVRSACLALRRSSPFRGRLCRSAPGTVHDLSRRFFGAGKHASHHYRNWHPQRWPWLHHLNNGCRHRQSAERRYAVEGFACTFCTAVICGTPTPATMRVVQIEPGPIPTFTAVSPVIDQRLAPHPWWRYCRR